MYVCMLAVGKGVSPFKESSLTIVEGLPSSINVLRGVVNRLDDEGVTFFLDLEYRFLAERIQRQKNGTACLHMIARSVIPFATSPSRCNGTIYTQNTDRSFCRDERRPRFSGIPHSRGCVSPFLGNPDPDEDRNRHP